MPIWDDVLSEDDRRVYDLAGYGQRQGPGSRPALLVIDVTYNFTGDEGQTLEASVERYRNSCGPAAWAAVPVIARLLEAARARDVPVVYTRGRAPQRAADLGRWVTKNPRAQEDLASTRGLEIVDELAPEPGDAVIDKDKPSVFFGTNLLPHLIEAGVDTLVVTGCTTSGCVRASVVDAFSYNFRVAVVSDGVFDRGLTSHKMNLFDMHAKYADVLPAAEAAAYLGNGSA